MSELSLEQPEMEQRIKRLSLGSPSASAPPGGTGPGTQTLPKFKPTFPKFTVDPKTPSYYNVTITKVDPENPFRSYSPYTYTVKLTSELENNIPSSSSSYTTTSMVEDTEEKLELEPPPPYYELCRECDTEHHPQTNCPALPCKACFHPRHTTGDCPFFVHVPKGAHFDRINYEITCGCGNMFDEDKWVCSWCFGRPKIKSKRCAFCSKYTTHSSHECPKNKVAAAKLKAMRDQAFSRKMIPYTGYPCIS